MVLIIILLIRRFVWVCTMTKGFLKVKLKWLKKSHLKAVCKMEWTVKIEESQDLLCNFWFRIKNIRCLMECKSISMCRSWNVGFLEKLRVLIKIKLRSKLMDILNFMIKQWLGMIRTWLIIVGKGLKIEIAIISHASLIVKPLDLR